MAFLSKSTFNADKGTIHTADKGKNTLTNLNLQVNERNAKGKLAFLFITNNAPLELCSLVLAESQECSMLNGQ